MSTSSYALLKQVTCWNPFEPLGLRSPITGEYARWNVFNQISVWFLPLRDILTVTPIPRLRYALTSVDRDEVLELMRTCVRLYDYRHEGVFGSSASNAVRRQIPVENPDDGCTWIVPGGDCYVLNENENQRMTLYGSTDGEKIMNILEISGLGPQQKVHLKPRIVPTCSYSFVIARTFQTSEYISISNTFRPYVSVFSSG
jgi:hypothetical protein